MLHQVIHHGDGDGQHGGVIHRFSHHLAGFLPGGANERQGTGIAGLQVIHEELPAILALAVKLYFTLHNQHSRTKILTGLHHQLSGREGLDRGIGDELLFQLGFKLWKKLVDIFTDDGFHEWNRNDDRP